MLPPNPHLSVAGALVALALIASISARAHCVWIEPDAAGRMVIRFAEPGEDFETSPGHLDELSPPAAFQLATNSPTKLEASKQHDAFLLAGAAVTNTVCAETGFVVRGNRKPYFFTRWQPAGLAASKPLLTLDLVPTGKPGEALASFRGAPLAGVKATIYTPEGKEQELTADTSGLLHFDATEPGQYLLTIAHHREQVAGFDLGRPYEQTSYNCSLVWRVSP